ncbi:hypothetical protein JCM24511_00652 [Saitozyma sp. JCM 24511]|nr:hypothetical protein JCM24511_00652 [Saitozyma sp. JCM 24511]
MADQEDYAGVPWRRRHSDTDSWTRSVIIGIDPDLLPPGGSRLSSDSQTIVLRSPTGSTALSLPSRSPHDYDSAHDWESVHEYARSAPSPSSSDGDAHGLSGGRNALVSPHGSESGRQSQPPSPRSSGRSDSSPLSPWSPGGAGTLPVVPEEEEDGHPPSTDCPACRAGPEDAHLSSTDPRIGRAERPRSAITDSCSEDDDLCSEDENCSQCSDDDESDHKYDQFNAELEELRQNYRSLELGRKSKSAPPTPSAVHADSQKWRTVSPAGFSSIISGGSSSTQSWLPGRQGGSVPFSSRQHDRRPPADDGGDSSDSTETVIPGGTSGRSSRRSSRSSSKSKSRSKEPAIRNLRIASRAGQDPPAREDGHPDEPTDIEDEVQVGVAQRGV